MKARATAFGSMLNSPRAIAVLTSLTRARSTSGVDLALSLARSSKLLLVAVLARDGADEDAPAARGSVESGAIRRTTLDDCTLLVDLPGDVLLIMAAILEWLSSVPYRRSA